MCKRHSFSILIICLLLVSCTQISSSPGTVTTSTQSPVTLSTEKTNSFTYATSQGAIYQVTLSGQKRQIVPPDGTEKWFLKWSPDQTLLAYVVAEFTQGDRSDTLWVVNAVDSKARSLFGPAKALHYSWQDDQTIYLEEALSFEDIPFDKDTAIQAYIVDTDAGNIQEVERQTELFPLPKESPNGERAIWNDPADDKWTLYLLDSQNNKLAVIYTPPPGRVISGVWAPDSQKLAIIRPEDEEIYLYEIKTDDWLKVSSLSATHEKYRVGNLQWSPDGKRLSYTLSDKESVNQICLLLIEEQSEKCFDTRWISNEYTWSSDGSYIAYLGRTPSEEIDIFVIDISKDTVRNLTEDGNSIIEEKVVR